MSRQADILFHRRTAEAESHAPTAQHHRICALELELADVREQLASVVATVAKPAKPTKKTTKKTTRKVA